MPHASQKKAQVREVDPTEDQHPAAPVDDTPVITYGRKVLRKPTVRMEIDYQVDQRILLGIDAIAAYLKCSNSTVRRYIERLGLPAMQRADATYMTSTGLLDQWILTVWSYQRQHKDEISQTAKALTMPWQEV